MEKGAFFVYYPGIEAFLAIVRTQNISRAAENINLAQSTVSKRLQVLEQELGTILIERGKGNKAFRLTEAGESFIGLAERWQSLWRETQGLQSSASQLSLSIGTLDSMNYAVFPPLFHALSRHQPKINLKVVTSHSAELYDLLERRQVDVAFSLLSREHPTINVEKHHAEPMVGLCKASAPYARSEPIHPHELDSNNELFVYWGLNYQCWHDQWWAHVCPGRIILDTAQLILSFFSTESQWAIVPLSVAKIVQKRGDYHIFNFSEPPPDRICYKITHKYPKASTVSAIKILDHYFDLMQKNLL
jgi:DNA-binding transcriptional LysR family regulator